MAQNIKFIISNLLKELEISLIEMESISNITYELSKILSLCYPSHLSFIENLMFVFFLFVFSLHFYNYCFSVIHYK